MSELVSAYPTAGGIYWWAGKLGGPVWAWFTGWFNLIGLVGVVASVDYACAFFLNILLGLYNVRPSASDFGDTSHAVRDVFALFVLILSFTRPSTSSAPAICRCSTTSPSGGTSLGVAVIIAILIFVPDNHQSVDFVFTHTINNSGFSGTGMFWFYVLPLGFLLTMYTITGYDASAHICEETNGAAMGAAKGVWRSVFCSAVIGWIVLLAITFAPSHVGAITRTPASALGSSLEIFSLGADPCAAQDGDLIISTIGQLFCGWPA